MTSFERVSSRAVWEQRVGYCRALRAGELIFVTDISRWAEFGRAHAEFFGEHRPTTTMVEVRRLISAEMLIEIEADAVL